MGRPGHPPIGRGGEEDQDGQTTWPAAELLRLAVPQCDFALKHPGSDNKAREHVSRGRMRHLRT